MNGLLLRKQKDKLNRKAPSGPFSLWGTMSVISTFAYLFTADTSDIDKGLKDADKKSDDLKKSLDQTDNAAKKLASSFTDMLKGALAAGAALITWGALKSIAIDSAEATNALDANARALRLDADELATWSGVVERAGGTAEGFQATVRGMLDKGIRDPLEALGRVADRFKGLNDRQADRLGASLGLDKGTIEAMREGTAGLQKLIDHQRRLGQVTEEQLEVARKFKMQQQDLNTVTDDIRRRIATLVLPILTQWLEKLQNLFLWMRDKKEFVVGFFVAVAAIIGAAFLPAMVRATAATLVFLAPWALLIAQLALVAGAIALVVDDIHAFRNGANSLIGEISKNWPVVGEIVNELCDALEILWDLAKSVFGFLADGLFAPSQAFDNFGKAIDAVMTRLGERFPYIAEVIKGFGTSAQAVSKVVVSAFELMWSLIRPILDGVAAAFNLIGTGAQGVANLLSSTAMAKQPVANAADARSANSVPPAPAVPPKAPAFTAIPTTGTPAAPRAAGTQTPAVEQIPAGPVLRIPDAKPGAKSAEPVSSVSDSATAIAAARATAAARAVVAQAAAHPLSATTSNSITNMSNSSKSKTVNVETGPITVQTQATDAKGVAEALGKSLKEQMQSANDEFDDGIIS